MDRVTLTCKVYTEHISKRLVYVLDFLSAYYRVPFEPVTDRAAFEGHAGPKVRYGITESPVDVPAFGLLQDGFMPPDLNLRWGQWKTLPVPFSGTDVAGTGFDLFSGIFYLLCRWEEHFHPNPDEHGRHQPDPASPLHGDVFLKPWINLWLREWAGEMKQHWPEMMLHTPEAKWISTVDVDFGFRYLGKGWRRSVGSLMRKVFTGQWKACVEQCAVLAGAKKDPYEVYGKLPGTQRYFLLHAPYGRHNKGLRPFHRQWKRLIQGLSEAEREQLGWHPSYGTYNDIARLAKEKQQLEALLRRPVNKSRMHFLQFRWPDTLKKLETLGIRRDFSMGYASRPGFRAGTNQPFHFYDLREERPSDLQIVPIALMDGTLKDYLKLPPGEAEQHITAWIDICRDAGGPFVSLWHEHTLSPDTPWRRVFEKMAQYCEQNNMA